MECNAPAILLNVASKRRVTALLSVELGESAAQASIKVRWSIGVEELTKFGERDSRAGVEVQHRSPPGRLRVVGVDLDAVDDAAILAHRQRRDEMALQVREKRGVEIGAALKCEDGGFVGSLAACGRRIAALVIEAAPMGCRAADEGHDGKSE